ncbi:hypothetical protein [Arachidicoccus ginsenosidimutans]|uniref:hypothetical protein n=1 Tax=Arachidicoccus sp. BS20 TaxID=1850526 RepID=UPI0012E826AB|nr:hypothetical protein [Arachidicoccus sp. BS20]
MSKTLKNILLISAIVLSTVGVILCIMAFFSFIFEIFKERDAFCISLGSLFGITGYIGLWKSLLDKTNYYYRTNNLLLILGLLSYIILLFTIHESMPIKGFEDLLETLIFFEPCIVAIIILIDNFTQIKHKRNS